MLLKKVIFCLLISCLSYTTHAQESTDSLWGIWENESVHDTIRLDALYNHAYKGILKNNPDSVFSLAQLMLEYSTVKGIRKYQAMSFKLFARSKSALNLEFEALKNWLNALKIYKNIEDKKGIALSYWNIGLSYYYMDQYADALNTYSKSLKLLNELEDTFGISGVLTNIGLIYEVQGDYAKALEYFEEGAEIIEKSGSLNDVALNKIGFMYMKLGKESQALDYFENRLIQIENGVPGPYFNYAVTKCSILNGIGDIYVNLGEYSNAMNYYQNSLEIASNDSSDYLISNSELLIGNLYEKMNKTASAIEWCSQALERLEATNKTLLSKQQKACECLYKSFQLLGNHEQAFIYFKQFNALKDSLRLQETAKSIERMEFSNLIREDSIKQADKALQLELRHHNEILRKDKTRNTLFGLGAFFILLSIFIFSRYKGISKSKAEIQKEKKKSDDLLLNILPIEIAEELKNTGVSKARHIDQTSILFTDFVQFTETSSKLTSENLVVEINKYFKEFDAICYKYGIEKIKTIGDSYMAVSSLGDFKTESTLNLVLASLEMNQYVLDRLLQKKGDNSIAFEMRTGIHTGSVAAGIVGDTKFQYDIWGDAVNTASRMESNGEAGKINISSSTYEIIKNDPRLEFIHRGRLNIKGKGEVEMYFVERKGEN